MLSTEYRESIERRFQAFCKAVLQIAALLGKPRTTVNYQNNAALKQLRTEMEKMNDEE